MKVAVPANDDHLDAAMEEAFSRGQRYLLIDPYTMAFEAVKNPVADVQSDKTRGIQAALMIVEKGIRIVIAGRIGPNAFQAMSSSGVRVFVGASGTVREAVEKYKTGQLEEAKRPYP